MKCKDCLYKSNCSLREIASDLTGCEGHSKERLTHKDKVKCSCCKTWVRESQAFKNITYRTFLCFNCY